MATASSQMDNTSQLSEVLSGANVGDFEADEDGKTDTETNALSQSMRDKDRKIGHRRVDKKGIVSYKKKPTSELMAAIQLGIGQSVGGLSAKPERDVLMQDFGVVEVVFFPGEGSNLTPAHHCSDFRFKTYAPVAFRYFRDLFGIQPDDFMLSLCDEPLKELSNPGASGSIFYLTQDDEFIIKTVQHKEADFLQKLLPGYFLNISQNKRTLLPKFYGLFCYQCGGKNIRFTVMNNLLPSTVDMHEKYDMKGSTYKRKASKHERSNKYPTLKDLDFMDNNPDGLLMEKDTYDALVKTLQRDCRVLESFKIMDYSLLVGIYNLDQAKKEKQSSQQGISNEHLPEMTDRSASTSRRGSNAHYKPHDGHTALSRGKSFKTRIGQYSTPLESIQGNTELQEEMLEDEDVPPGGIPARNGRGEHLLLYLGIIDILQSFRLKKRLEHTVKSMIIDGDTISVHRPSYYAHRFLQYHATRVFKKAATALKHSPSKKRSISKSRHASQVPDLSDDFGSTVIKGEKPLKSISFQDDFQNKSPGAVGGKPDLLPEYSKISNQSIKYSPTQSHIFNINGNSRHLNRSEPYNLSTYGSEDALSAGTASTASLRGIGVSSTTGGHKGSSPPLSLSESTPTHTEFTEGTPSFTNSSPSCSSDALGFGHSYSLTSISTATTSPAAFISTSISGYAAASWVAISAQSIAAAASMDITATTAPHLLHSPAAASSTSSTTTTTGLTTTTTDMGSTYLLDTAGLSSPARSPAHSPDIRNHSRSGRGRIVSPLIRPSQLGKVDQVRDSAATSEPVKDIKVKITPESPPSKGLSEVQITSTLQATVVESTPLTASEITATESEMTRM